MSEIDEDLPERARGPSGAEERERNAVLSGGGEMGALMRSIDWSTTAVGPVEGWPQSLRTAISILLESRFGMMVAWGPQLTHFYNDAYRPTLGATKHPSQGKSVPSVFPEIWSTIGPLFDGVMAGVAVSFDDLLVPLDRNGYLEECYFTFCYSPIRNESHAVGGVLVTVTESTTRVVSDRRLHTLRDLAARASETKVESQSWLDAATTLGKNADDVPFALLYAVDADGAGATLMGSSGPLHGAIAAPRVVFAEAAERSWPLEAVVTSNVPALVDDVQARFGAQLGQKWAEPVRRALALPVRRPGTAAAYGVVIIGLNPRGAHDAAYRDFCGLVADQVATAVGSARAYAEERTRAEALTGANRLLESLAESERQARSEAELASRAKDEFLAILGHELRNPLAPMLTALRLMQERGFQASDLAILERQVSALVRLVDDLLDVSRIARGKVELRKKRIELSSVVHSGLETASPLLEERKHHIDLSVPAEGLAIDGDADRLSQVVSNLLTNAAKYSEPGTEIHVAARAHETQAAQGTQEGGSRVKLSIRDHGIGIPPEKLTRIFDMFVQQPQSLDRAGGGIGLGLTIVRNLVTLHGGHVTAASAGPGTGSEFVVDLPLAAPLTPVPLRVPTRKTVDLPKPKTFRILVVDDNEDAADTLAEFLTEVGHEVRTTQDGPSALDVARTFKPEICLLDIGLPVMDGYELARRLRELEGLPPDLRLVAITGYGQDADRRRSAEARFDRHLVKPIDLDVLLSALSGP